MRCDAKNVGWRGVNNETDAYADLTAGSDEEKMRCMWAMQMQ